MFSNPGGLKFANTDELAVFPNPGVGVVRADAVRIICAVAPERLDDGLSIDLG